MLDLNTIYKAQVDNRWAMAKTTAKERKALLLKLKESIESHREEIKAALYSDFKKPYAESELTEIHVSLDEINFIIKNLKRWMSPRRVRTPLSLFGASSSVRYEAKGLVLILAPWNYPFLLLISPLIAAIAAGNCVIARPSEKTPHTAKIIEKIIGEVFPENIAKIVIGEIDSAEKLLELKFDHVFFTGSTNVGKKVMLAAAKNLTPVTLELGGKSPVIVDRNVDLQDCVEKIAWGKFINGGQTCVAPDYLFLPEESKEEFLRLFKKQIQKNYGETSNERIQTKDFSRIIDLQAYERLAKKIDGEKNLLGDDPLKDERFIPPTVLVDVKTTSPIMEDEIFGPILPVLTYKSIDTVIDYIQKSPKPLACYIFSKNKKTIKTILKNTTAGGTAINHVLFYLANPHLPFGGVGTSGMGSYHGEFGFKTFSHERAVFHQGPMTLTKIFFPPYTGLVHKIAFKFLRWLE